MKKIFLVFIFSIVYMFFMPRLNAQTPESLIAPEPIVSMDFQDISIKDALKMFSMQAGMNFIASEAVADRKVTLYFDKVPLSQAMDKIFSANNLSYELDSKANIFVVKDWGKMEIETVTKIFYLKYATVSVSSLKEELSKSLTIGSSTQTKISRSKFNEESEGGITSAVKKLLSPAPVGSLIEDFRTNSFIITDTPMKMKVISQIIAALDVPVPQVMLEVEMLDVSKDVIDKIGINFGDTPFTAIITGAAAAMGFPYGGWGKLSSIARGSVSVNQGVNSYSIQLDFIRTHSDTKFLARPRLLTLNNETAEISITTDEAVQATPAYSTTTSGATYITGYTIKRATELALTSKGIGISLRVTPQVNLESNEITMVINPESSSTSSSSFSSTTTPIRDPEVRTSKSIVKIKDGETVILGGLIHQDKEVTERRLPILGDIPILGRFFRHQEHTAGLERELIIFITPRIIRNSDDINLAEIKNFRLPVREQSAAVAGLARDCIINSNMSKFEKSH